MVDRHVRDGVCTVWIVDDDSGVLVPTAGPNAGPLPTLDPDIARRGANFARSLPTDRISVSDVRTGSEWEPWREQAISSGIGGSWNRPIRDAVGAVYGMLIVYRNELREPREPERQAVELAAHLAAVAVHRAQDADRLAHAATHDIVTDLPNRRLFLERLEQAVNRQRRGARPPAVLFVDLDRFKQINDRAGHTAGDEALRELGQRLLDVVRPTDVVARLGGDEFGVLCDETGEDEAMSVAARLLSAVCEPMQVGGRVHRLSASIGVAAGRPGVSHDALVRCADVAMYRAKAHGAGGIVAFRSGMADRGRGDLEQDLRRAVEQRDIVVHYQPVLSLHTARWIAVEALARWRHPRHGWIAPSTFVGLAEEIGLAVALGDCVLQQVCDDAAQWTADSAMEELLVGVNVSARQLTDPRFVPSVERLVAGAGIGGARLFVELTETSMMEEFDVARAAVAAMERLGINLVIDDFGTGHSTLARLRQFPAIGLKLDRSFVAEIGEDSRSEDIVAAVVQLAHAVGMAVCAEGIETTHQLSTVKRLGVDVAQGYLLARPMPAAELVELVAKPTGVLATS
jgi:diguanylate cyclase (GGDEF)-like protein